LGVCAAPAPSARATAEDTPPPIPPFDHHRHQHEERKDEGDGGDDAGAEGAHEIRLRDTDERLQRKHGENGQASSTSVCAIGPSSSATRVTSALPAASD
jgi:hypothetical protein